MDGLTPEFNTNKGACILVKNAEVSSKLLTENKPRVTESQYIIRVFFTRKIVVFGLAIIIIAIITAIFAPLLAPYKPNAPDLDSALQQPSREHLLGTDSLGRDTLSRLIYGTRVSLIIGITAVGFAAAIGMFLGSIAGYFGGITYSIIMRFIDAVMAFPGILLALVIAAVLGGGMKSLIIALGTMLTSIYARLMCSQVLSVKENDYIQAQKSLGSNHSRVIISHIVPNCFPPLIVLITLNLGSAILAEAGLSFIGVGITPPTATWGNMVSNGYRYLVSNPLLSIVPGAAIMLVVFSFNMVGDGLRDALDPRLRGVL
jgi:peptide/nickel transport system permease protein